MPRIALIIDTDDLENLYAELNSSKFVNRYDYVDEIEPDVLIVGVTDVTPNTGG